MEESEHNHPTSAPELFLFYCLFLQEDIVIIKNDFKAHIPPLKTLVRLQDLYAKTYSTIQDLYNAFVKIFW